MENVIIHGFAPSTYTRSARMAAIEKGIEHELVPVAYGKPEHFALHPFGKMPAMTVGETTTFETLAIMSELDDRSEYPTLFGTTPRQKADILTLVSVAVDYAYQPVVHIEVKDGKPDPNQLAAADRVIDWLEARLGSHPFLAGDELTAADLFFAPMLAYHANQVGEDRAYKKRPCLRRWMDGMGGRASFKETA
ncbi:glutathione S-transferase family protein [Devosia sp.]|uniref:glutathione S-transferase family protein n=1 Tax=Devosia sp. TaxID=1871048 RepID=UPI00293176CE|nr:glutathione S-transferase family protein [Devosia sp.]